MISGEKLFADDSRGISPVIGVILIVAITVVLAAGVGAFALGYGQNQQEASPTPAVERSVDSQQVTFSVAGGDSFEPGDSKMKIDVTVGDTSSGATAETSFSTDLDNSQTKSVSVGSESVRVEYIPSISGDEVTAGDSFTVELDTSDSKFRITSTDATITRSTSSDSSQTLYSDSFSRNLAASSGGGGGGGGGGSSSGLASKFTKTQDERTSLSPNTDDRYEVTLEATEDDALDASNHQIIATFEVENTATGATETRSIRHDSPVPEGDMTEFVQNLDPDQPSDFYSPSISSGNTFDSGDSFTIEIIELDSDEQVVSYEIFVADYGTLDTVTLDEEDDVN